MDLLIIDSRCNRCLELDVVCSIVLKQNIRSWLREKKDIDRLFLLEQYDWSTILRAISSWMISCWYYYLLWELTITVMNIKVQDSDSTDSILLLGVLGSYACVTQKAKSSSSPSPSMMTRRPHAAECRAAINIIVQLLSILCLLWCYCRSRLMYCYISTETAANKSCILILQNRHTICPWDWKLITISRKIEAPSRDK